MKRFRFILVTSLIFLLLLVLYNIWSLPFEILSRTVILPAARVVGDGLDRAASPIRFLSKLSELERQNRDLEIQKNSLEAEIVRLNEDDKFCEQVGLEKQVSGEGKSVVAKIIGRTPQNFNQVLIVDKGTNDGITENAAVLSSGYLIGQVLKTYEKKSEIVLISNHNNIVPAMLDKSRELGLIQGSLEGLVLTDIPSATVVEDGENVLSSGLGGDIPKGLLIGKVASSKKIKGLFQILKVDSPFVLSKTEVVTILQNE